MAKDTDPFELNAAAKQAMELAQQAVDTYFDFLKKSVWSFPSGGTQLGEKLKDHATEISTPSTSLLRGWVKRKILKKRFKFRPNLCSPN